MLDRELHISAWLRAMHFSYARLQRSCIRVFLVFNITALLLVFDSGQSKMVRLVISSVGFVLHLGILGVIRWSAGRIAAFEGKPDRDGTNDVRATIFELASVGLVLMWFVLSITHWFRYLFR